MGLAVGRDADRLAGQEPLVEGRQGFHVRDVKLLANIDNLQSIGRRWGEVDAGERGMRLQVLQVHDTSEAVDVGVDLAVGPDGAVDSHGEAVGLSACHDDALDAEFGIVKLALGNLGYGDKNSRRRR